MGGVQGTLGIQQHDGRLGPRAVTAFGQRQGALGLGQFLGLRRELFIKSRRGVQGCLHFAEGSDDVLPVIRQEFLPPGLSQFPPGGQMAGIEGVVSENGI